MSKPKRGEERMPRRGMNWRLVFHTVLISLVIWVVGIALGVLFGNNPTFILWYIPAALVTIIAYYRSEQPTRFQVIAEAAFTGAVFVVIVQLLYIGLFLGPSGQPGPQ